MAPRVDDGGRVARCCSASYCAGGRPKMYGVFMLSPCCVMDRSYERPPAWNAPTNAVASLPYPVPEKNGACHATLMPRGGGAGAPAGGSSDPPLRTKVR